MKKRILCLALVMVMIFTLLPMSAFAAEVVSSGKCGSNLTWTLDSEGTLTISGTGKMEDFSVPYGAGERDDPAPWSGNSSQIKRVSICQGVENVGNYAFSGCAELTSVTIPDSVTNIGKYAFCECSSLQSVKVPDRITSIGICTFAGCTELTNVTIPDSVTSIGDYAFSDCSSLQSVTIPDSVTSIGDSAFYNCTQLTEINYNAKAVTNFSNVSNVFYNAGKDGRGIKVTFGDSVEKIPAYLFYAPNSVNHPNISNVSIGSNVTSIGGFAFSGCTEMTNVTISDSVTSIGVEAFYNCSGLRRVTIGNSVTSIGDYAFSCCTGLTSITIGNSVTSIGAGAFSDCSSVQSISIPDSVTSIGGYAFYNCTGLQSVTIGNSVTSIGNYLLAYCGEIKYIVIPKSVTTIDAKAFYCCEVANIAYGGTKQEWKEAFAEGTLFAIGYVHFNCTSLDNHWKTSKIVEPGCFDQGYTEFTCDCGYSCCDNYVPALGHDLVHHDGKAATCTEKGWEAYDTCSRCDYSSYKEIPAAGHSYTSSVTAPTCTEKGYTTYTCTCGDSYVDSYTNALGHDFGEWTETTAPTCTAKGTEVRTCTRCNATETRDVEALGHNTTHHAAKAATCTEKGWEAYDTCSRCDYTTYKEIPATGHSYTSSVTAPTCTEKGYTTYTCSCGDSYVADYVDALGHDFGEWTVTTAPTCTEKGVETRYCSRCDATETRDVNALGHDYKDGVCDVCGAKDPNYKPPVKENPFTDVKEKDYFYVPVLWAVENGITNGTSKNTFSPNATCTRAQTVTFLWRAMGCPEVSGVKNPFVDVKPSDYYYKAVLWAVKNGVTQGIDATHFGPNKTVTRAQTVTFMWRAAGSPAVSGVKNPFVDVKPSDYYCKAVLWAVESGITNGMSATTFAPNSGCTRGQIVTFLFRHIEK